MLKIPRSNSIPDITMIVSSFDDRLNKRRCNTIIIRSSASFSAIHALERFQTLAPPAHHFSSFSLPRPTPPSGRLAGAQGERQRGGEGRERERKRERNPLPVFPIRWERESAFSSVSRGLDGAGGGAAGPVDGRGSHGERSRLRYSPFRNQCPRYTKYHSLQWRQR